MKHIVAQLAAKQQDEHITHRSVHRPWGYFDVLGKATGFQVKRLLVNPGAALSLQKHKHRTEHWIVLSGVAEVTCNDHVFLLKKNQITSIPLGSIHRLKNPGAIVLELIEVQLGNYLGEDDIVRLEDAYGRV